MNKEVAIKYWKKRNCTQVGAIILSNIMFPDCEKVWKLASSRNYRVTADSVKLALRDLRKEKVIR